MSSHRGGTTRRRRGGRAAAGLLGLGLAAALAATGCGGGSGSGAAEATASSATSVISTSTRANIGFTPTVCGTYSGTGCAPESGRVDLVKPIFSNPTRITNPLFPIGKLTSALLLGNVDGEPFRSETTLLPRTIAVEWDGQRIETLASQYTAYLNGRIEEVALDRYAQADDGSVWYFGEDVVD